MTPVAVGLLFSFFAILLLPFFEFRLQVVMGSGKRVSS